MPAIEWVFAFLLLGSFVGFMAGLLGIGGGGIIVPILTSLFLAQNFPIDVVVHLALGTSMASIILTSFSSLRSHHSMNNVIWSIVRQMTPGILIGTFFATFLIPYLSSIYLASIFSAFMLLISAQLFFDKKPKPSRQLKGRGHLTFAGTGIGSMSALISIGGGSMTVPYLIWHNINIKKAIGTSAAIGLPLSIAGTFGYIINGWDNTQDYSLGFVYLPAVLLISLTSFIIAPYGAKCAHKLPVPLLKKIFSVLLILLSIKMLASVA